MLSTPPMGCHDVMATLAIAIEMLQASKKDGEQAQERLGHDSEGECTTLVAQGDLWRCMVARRVATAHLQKCLLATCPLQISLWDMGGPGLLVTAAKAPRQGLQA